MDPLRLTGRIVDAKFLTREMPLRRPLRSPYGQVRARTIRLLRLQAEDGCTGIGEASIVDWLAATAPDRSEALLGQLVERIRSDTPDAQSLLRWSMDVSQLPVVRAALQSALLDVHAGRLGCTVASMLGAAPSCPPLAVSALLGDGDPEAMAGEAAAHAAAGLASFKIKVGRPLLEDDVERVSAVRDAVGPDARLRLDANRAWTLAQARCAIEALAAFGADLVEEPLRDRSDLARLHSPLRIALDESVRSMAELRPAIGRGGWQVLVLKLERVGGPLPAISMASTAAHAGIDVVFTDSIESRVGQAATVHVAAAAAARRDTAAAAADDQPAHAVGLGGMFLLEDGHAVRSAVPVDGPGFGVDAEATWNSLQPTSQS